MSESELIDIVESELAKTNGTLDERLECYEQVRTSIGTLRVPTAEALQNSIRLDRVIKSVERSHQKAPDQSKIDKAIGWLIETIASFKLKFGALAAGVATISDFIKPIASVTGVAMVAAAIGVSTILLLRPKIKLHRELANNAMAFSAALFVFSAVWFSAQRFIPGAEASGAVTKVVPGAEALQTAMLGTLSKIEGETRRTADSMEKLVPATLESKREISQDPLKELANLGIANPHDGWARALWSGNTKVMTLLLASNSPPDRMTLYNRLTYNGNEGVVSNPEVLKILRSIKPNVQKAICDSSLTTVASLLRNIGREEYIYYCGNMTGIVQRYKNGNETYWRSYCTQKAKFNVNCKQNDIESIIKAFADSDTVADGERRALKEILASFEIIRRAEGTSR